MENIPTQEKALGYGQIVEGLDRSLEDARGAGAPLQEVLNRLGDASYCFILIVLSAVFIQPISLGPLTMASGLTMALLGWQMMRGHATPKLPKKMGGILIHGKGWITALTFCKRVMGFLRRFTRPRLQHLVAGRYGIWLAGLLICIGGLLLAVPCVNLPFNNTFPALMVLCAAVALLEQDGFFVFVSIFWGLVTLVYFALVLKTVLFVLTQIYHWTEPYILHGYHWLKP